MSVVGPWIRTDELLHHVAANLNRTSAAELEPYYVERAEAGNQSAVNDIVSALTVRGYSTAQIDSWDQRRDFNRWIALWYTFYETIALHGRGVADIKPYDRREELQTVNVTVGGVAVEPALAGNVGGKPLGGVISEANYRFTMNTEF